jgi:hypothetical protein
MLLLLLLLLLLVVVVVVVVVIIVVVVVVVVVVADVHPTELAPSFPGRGDADASLFMLDKTFRSDKPICEH